MVEVSTGSSRASLVALLSTADIPGALRLVEQSGWNQVQADWELFIHLGAAFKLAAPDGGVIATAAVLPYPPRFGWISMVLVDKVHRRQGIATMLMETCMQRLHSAGLVPVLDATPAGREVYRLLGFQDGWPLSRWRRAGGAQPAMRLEQARTVRPLVDADWPHLAALDLQAFGADRTSLLRRLAVRSHGFACVVEEQGRISGYLLGRDGRQARQLGPLAARGEAAAQALLSYALARTQGPVLLDVLDRHTGFAGCLAAAGFSIERGYTRMALGCGGSFGDDALMVAIAGPELG